MSRKKVMTLERVRQAAATAFCEQRFERVSIARIAAESRCSMETIYEIFGSKEGLLVEAASYAGTLRPPPTLHPSDDGSLFGLLNYVNDRLEFLAQPSTFGYLRAGLNELGKYRGFLLKSLMEQRDHFASVTDEVQRLMGIGLLRRGDVRATTYTICAGTAFDSIAQQVLNATEPHIDNIQVIRLVFTPLVTRKGAKQLKEFVKLHAGQAPETAASCVTLYDLM